MNLHFSNVIQTVQHKLYILLLLFFVTYTVYLMIFQNSKQITIFNLSVFIHNTYHDTTLIITNYLHDIHLKYIYILHQR